jgi:hypothetical protein
MVLGEMLPEGETLVTAQRDFTTEVPRHGEEQPEETEAT